MTIVPRLFDYCTVLYSNSSIALSAGTGWSSSAAPSPTHQMAPPLPFEYSALPPLTAAAINNQQSPRRAPSADVDAGVDVDVPLSPLHTHASPPLQTRAAADVSANAAGQSNAPASATASDAQSQSDGRQSERAAGARLQVQSASLPQSPRSLDSGIGSRAEQPEPSPLAFTLSSGTLAAAPTPTPTLTLTPTPRTSSGQSNASYSTLRAAATAARGTAQRALPSQHSQSLSPDVRVQSLEQQTRTRTLQMGASRTASSDAVHASRSASRLTALQVPASGSGRTSPKLSPLTHSPGHSAPAATPPSEKQLGAGARARDSPSTHNQISEGARRVSDLSNWWYKPKMTRPHGAYTVLYSIYRPLVLPIDY